MVAILTRDSKCTAYSCKGPWCLYRLAPPSLDSLSFCCLQSILALCYHTPTLHVVLDVPDEIAKATNSYAHFSCEAVGQFCVTTIPMLRLCPRIDTPPPPPTISPQSSELSFLAHMSEMCCFGYKCG